MTSDKKTLQVPGQQAPTRADGRDFSPSSRSKQLWAPRSPPDPATPARSPTRRLPCRTARALCRPGHSARGRCLPGPALTLPAGRGGSGRQLPPTSEWRLNGGGGARGGGWPRGNGRNGSGAELFADPPRGKTGKRRPEP